MDPVSGTALDVVGLWNAESPPFRRLLDSFFGVAGTGGATATAGVAATADDGAVIDTRRRLIG